MAVCPNCGTEEGHVSNGHRGPLKRWICGKCRKNFQEYPELKKEDKLPKKKILEQISQTYTESELKAIANGARLVPGQCKVPVVNFEGEHVSFVYITDTHRGSLYSPPEWIQAAVKVAKDEKVDFIIHGGDATEGMSSRPGHIYELELIGYTKQKEDSVNRFSEWEGKWYFIGGNHDGWFMQNSNIGADIVKDICDNLPDATYLGMGEGTISLKGKANIMVWHGLDAGGSYALSYRIQKIVESLPLGEKPNILLTGHDHKALFIPNLRGVHCIAGGCMQRQTPWMRQTKKSAMCGFWKIDVWLASHGIAKINPVFYPFYA